MVGSDNRRNAIITGAASGLGRAIALRLARDGWRMALVDVNDTANDETLRLVRSAGGDGFTYHMDVSQPSAWQALRNRLESEWQNLDLLVNNAGVAGSGEVGKYSIDDWHWILGINLNAGIYGCHYFIPWLKKNPRGAHIINTASLAAVAAKPGMAGYNVAKAGMLSLSETLYGELKPHNVGVTVVCPSFFQTNLLNEGRLEKIDRDLASKMMKVANFTADDVANAAVQAIADKRLYVVLPRQGRIFWRLKRFFPNYVCNLLAKDWAKQLAALKKEPPAAAPPQIAEKTAV
ncbi:MAG TPA: SDR family NAD(P)-dependent oxidoreductase [Pirellulales bacterium]|nr:SDR family NAD(P)-dependent oxidoreductase [Pirellulales bacterium]